mmetsp:Transcript_27975/g.24661  ORF Transcript_27975/g.24661 Transcript_27975/m.24661 type:complete len:95 (-) Transcript_27975:3121-3405(-)
MEYQSDPIAQAHKLLAKDYNSQTDRLSPVELNEEIKKQKSNTQNEFYHGKRAATTEGSNQLQTSNSKSPRDFEYKSVQDNLDSARGKKFLGTPK